MARTSVGLDVGGTRIRVALVDEAGTILRKKVIDGTRDPERAVEFFVELISEIDDGAFEAIGIGIPGRVNAHTGEVLSGGFLNLAGVDLAGILGKRFARPVAVANDCSMALLAEARVGAGRGLSNIVMLTIGTGIGGAAMLDGKIVSGRRSAGQLGHLIVREGGVRCVCGQSGCVEMYSSGTSFRRLASEIGFPAGYTCEQALSDAAQSEDARSLIRNWAGPLRAAISSLSASFDPDILLLGGGLGESAVMALRQLPTETSWYDIPVAPALLGDDAGVIGAALAGLDLVQSAPSAGKRLVMVNGIPATGKSRVSAALSARTGWPILALDTIKNPFLAEIGDVDRLFNRRLGKASYQAIWDTIAAAPAGSTFIVDAWFGFQPLDLLDAGISHAGITALAEIWCHAPGDVLAERYRARLSSRLPGHPGEAYIPELIALAERATPAGRGPIFDLDTTKVPDDDALAEWVTNALKGTPQ
ncbi:ROK family protein [Rhizobium sp. PAMB 3174]